jgi:hypothetical protein
LGVGRLPVVHRFGFGSTALRHHLRRTAFEIVSLRAAPPSGGYAYPVGSGHLGQLVRGLKLMDQLLYRCMTTCGLDRPAWALSVEALARKPI